MESSHAPRKRASRFKERIRRLHERLVSRYRCYAALSAAYEDFKENDLRYHVNYFTVNAFMGTLALFVAVSSLIGLLPQGELKDELVEGIMTILPVLRGDPAEDLNVFKHFGGLGVLSILFLIWTATKIFDAMEHGFSIVWRAERRKYRWRFLAALFMVGVIGLLFVLTFVIQFEFKELCRDVFRADDVAGRLAVSIAKPVIALAVDFLLFFFIYRVVTAAKPGLKKSAWVALLAAAAFLGSQYLLNLYFDYLYKVPVIFGSLSSGVILVLWLQLTGNITFYGAELIYVLENDGLIGLYRDRLRKD